MIKVYISLERIQSFLMAVPRLKEMLGANVLLAETVRRELTELVKSSAATSIDSSKLAGVEHLAAKAGIDPLAAADRMNQDKPIDLLEQRHVLQRDGGHFAALFADDGEADQFIQAAQTTLAEKLPGIRYSVRKETLGGEAGSQSAENDRQQCASPAARMLSPVDLPVFQVCQEIGNGPAVRKNNKGRWIGQSVRLRGVAGRRFKNGTSADVAGLITRQLRTYGKVPNDFKQLCAGEYLAVIHADGNGMGDRGNDWREKAETQHGKQSVLAALQEELLYYDMRVKVRAAVVKAIEATFKPVENDQHTAPFQILMLGGDDLLFVCRAQYALPFVRAYAQALFDLGPLLDGERLGIGAGVVIAAHTLPFHYLHALAEDLAASAKTLYRQTRQPSLSVVDWMVCTASWSDDPIKLRQKTARVEYRTDAGDERLLLSAKPYRVRHEPAEAGQSLASLLTTAEQLIKLSRRKQAGNGEGAAGEIGEISSEQGQRTDEGKGARSQWRKLAGQLRLGRMQADLCFSEMPDGSCEPLEALLSGGTDPERKKSVWHQPDPTRQTFLTYVADAVELFEIPKLKSAEEDGR